MIENQTQILNFPIYKNFSLLNSFWGSALPQDIIALLDSVITDFYSNFDNTMITSIPVLVMNGLTCNPPKILPERIKIDNFVLIYLATQDRSWCQYSYQFSHELCHNVVDIDYPPENDRFGWLEESICELASLCTLNKMSITWQTNPPYPNWIDYSNSLSDYVLEIIKDKNNILEITFFEWLNNNLPELFNDRCKRSENRIIALHLLPIFTKKPELWKAIQYLKSIIVKGNMSLNEYLLEWKNTIPSALHSDFNNIIDIFIQK